MAWRVEIDLLLVASTRMAMRMFGNAISLRREQAQHFEVTTAGAGE